MSLYLLTATFFRLGDEGYTATVFVAILPHGDLLAAEGRALLQALRLRPAASELDTYTFLPHNLN